MENKIRVLANIFIKNRLDESLFQFNRTIPAYRYHVIRAFVKNCPLIKNATEEDFQTVKLITIVCSNYENAMTILNGLEYCDKNSFFYELFRKKANAVDTEVIKIALNSVYGKCAFNRDTDSVSEEFNNLKAVDAKELLEKSAPKNNSISSEIEYIAKNLDDSDLFLQLAEEAAELSQACLKYVRSYRGNNPTNDSEDVYLKNIIEELTDVRVSADVLNIEEDIDTYINKIHRWADRIRKKNGGSTK